MASATPVSGRGRGGMGVVWLADRADGAHARQVALKLPHRHLLENLNAADLRRHRQHLPVRAHRLGAGQRLARFVRRHRLPVALGSALALALVVGLAGVLWQAQETRAQARRAEAVKDFLLGVFNAADPRLAGGKPGGKVTAKALPDRSAARFDAQFADAPDSATITQPLALVL